MKIKASNGKEYEFFIGADPEFFVSLRGKPVSAYGLVPGTKEAPHKVPNGAVQVDGMALEFNINPAKNAEEFEQNMSSVLGSILSMVPGYDVHKTPLTAEFAARGYTNIPAPVADFGLPYIESQPEEAKELGCSPDFNAYTKLANPRPDAQTPFRTASGHVHIGWHSEPVDINDPSHLEACYALTKVLDLYLGVPSLIWDRDVKRRSLYGAAGAFRPKPYGMEYRVLSNSWIMEPLLRKFVYCNTIEAIKATFNDPDIGDRTFGDASARSVIAQQGSWNSDLSLVIQSLGIKTPKDYR